MLWQLLNLEQQAECALAIKLTCGVLWRDARTMPFCNFPLQSCLRMLPLHPSCSPPGRKVIRCVTLALGMRFRHTLLFRRCLVGMAPLGSSFDGLKFSIDDPAVFLESQYLSHDGCRFCLACCLSSTVHRVAATLCLIMLSLY